MVLDSARVTRDVLRKVVGAGPRILDIGAGTGLMSERLAEELPADVVGVEGSSEMLERAEKRRPTRGSLSFLQGMAWALPPLPVFDAAVMSYLLRYLEPEDMGPAFQEAGRVVRPDGALVVVDLALPRPGPRPVLGAWSRGADDVLEAARQAGFRLEDMRYPLFSSLFVFRRM